MAVAISTDQNRYDLTKRLNKNKVEMLRFSQYLDLIESVSKNHNRQDNELILFVGNVFHYILDPTA